MVKILFMGRKRVAANCLRFLHGLPNVKVIGVLTDSQFKVSPATEVAKELGLELYDFETALIKMKEGHLNFDLGLSILYWRKLKEEFLSIPNLGVVNFHPAPLPEYKGTGGYNLAILEAKTTWGVTAHYIDKDIDTGEIIDIVGFSIDEKKETVVTLEKKSMIYLEELVKKVCLKIISCKSYLETVPNSGGRYISRQEMEEMKRIEHGDDVDRKIRAFWFPPYDGAYIVIDGKKYTLTNRVVLNSLAPKESTSLFSTNE